MNPITSITLRPFSGVMIIEIRRKCGKLPVGVYTPRRYWANRMMKLWEALCQQ